MKDDWFTKESTQAGLGRVLETATDDFAASFGPHTRRLLCPVCGSSYQHTGTPFDIPGQDAYEAGWGGRGNLLVVPVWCEEGHEWEMCFGFHKGETFSFVRINPVLQTTS
ncbi:MAG: hypothetical protein H0T57_13865 [Rubrobacter sp.]|jgi:hypothetical protein|nr:hypothetical protein [Rubrobacter sp.]MBA3614724.1 hypothetical protein [Rubrobacteraceae bacterium]